MKQQFIVKKFSPERMRLIEISDGILDEYARMRFRLSLRQLYYQMVARDLLPDSWRDPVTHSKNNTRSYKNLGDIVSDARLAGLLDWDRIEDRGREAFLPAAWESPAEIVRAAANQFRVDRWEGQENYVEVMVEKDALSGVLEGVCRELHVRLTANKGYSSSTALYDAGRRINAALTDSDKSFNCAHIFYLGDHDPSGIDMTRDVTERLKQFSGIDREDELQIHRLALNIDQINLWNPPENPAKTTDSRYNSYVDMFGESSWELDAVEPQTLAQLLRDGIVNLVDEDQWNLIAKRELGMRKELLAFADNYGKQKRKKIKAKN